MNAAHYCPEHQSKFYRNEKVGPDGEAKVWYSHKKADGTGFCVEKTNGHTNGQLTLPNTRAVERPSSVSQSIFMCNAMNNAVALASSGKIEMDQLGSYYKKILSEFQSTI